MKMFIWSSKLLEAYGQGTIAVLANTVEEARRNVLDDYSPLEEDSVWEDMYLQSLKWSYDDDLEIEMQKKREVLKEDIQEEPIISDLLVIKGSE